MQFHPTGTDPTATALLVCRNTRWNVAVMLAILWAVPIFWWCIAAPTWVLVITTAVPLLISGPLVTTWRKRGRADNWVFAVERDGVWLNLRDCEYHEAEPGETVVFLPYRDIGTVRHVVHRYTTPSDDGGSTHYRDSYLELRLAAADQGQLREAIDKEQHRNLPERSYLGGFVTAQTTRTGSAIQWEGADAVRIKFSVSTYRLRPSAKKILSELRQFIRVAEDVTGQTNDWQAVDGVELDDLVRRLATGGQRIDAMQLLQRRRGLSLTDAKLLVDELCGRAAASA